ncbi:MAG: hypothetical protein ACYTXL_27345, partial [Nostoc sp.]
VRPHHVVSNAIIYAVVLSFPASTTIKAVVFTFLSEVGIPNGTLAIAITAELLNNPDIAVYQLY